jgi:hypothetical protein
VLAISTTRQRTTAPGTTLELLVLASGAGGCIGVDLASGALTRATYPDRSLVPLVAFDVAAAPVGGPADPDEDPDPDPLHPEEIELAALPKLAGHLGRRRAERWLRPLLHPTSEPILGFPGPALPFWELAGDRPSIAVIQPERPPRLIHRRGEARLRCRFAWRNLWHELPVVGTGDEGDRRLLIALSAPLQGYCYKVVAGLLP